MLGFKAETKAPMKISVTNGYTTGTEAAFNDIYNSIYTVGIETEKDLLLSNLPLSTSVLGSSIEGEVVGKYLPNTPSSIFVREGFVKFTEEFINIIKSQEQK